MKETNTLATFLKITFRISKSYIPLTILMAILDSIFVLVGIYIPKLIIAGLEKLDLSKVTDKSLVGIWNALSDQLLPIVYAIIALMGINLILRIITRLLNKHLQVKQVELNERFYQELSKKIMRLDYEKIENPNILDLKERAVFAAVNQSAIPVLMQSISSILKATFTLTGVIAIILTLNIYLLLIIFVLVFLTIILTFAFRNYQTQTFQKIVPINRKFSYYVSLIQDNTITKDVKMYNLGKIFTHKMYAFSREVNDELLKMGKLQGFFLSFTGLINNLQLLLVYLYMGYLVIYNGLKISDLTMYVRANQSFASNLQEFFGSIAGIRQTIHYLEPFMEFMNLEEAEVKSKGKLVLDEINEIEFRNVTFSYPRSDKKVLDNVSFKIRKGEKISIVGLNGAGKTTLIKLLCQLYHPTEGEILINGININEYEYNSYLNKLSAVFQDFKMFAFSLKENIILNEKEDDEKLQTVLRKNNLEDMVANLPNGVDTNLYKIFDKNGVELSYGQNQKVAISRALYKDSDLVILDEPTSALDPIAEYEVYKSFNNLIENKTAIYISHRMSSSIFCDKILVIEDGRVTAFDKHHNLLQNKNGLYYKLFMTQAQNYTLPQEV